MLQVAVIDDEPMVLETVSPLIKQEFQESIEIKYFQDGNAFLESKDASKISLVFLDIDMPSIDGFALAQKMVYVNNKSTIIFMSQLEHLVYRSFAFSPLWFVRKRCLEQDIHDAVVMYISKYMNKENSVSIQVNSISRSIPTSQILYFESMKHVIYIHLIDGSVLPLDRSDLTSLQMYENKLAQSGFLRTHKSFLVNYTHIQVINRNHILLKNQEKIPINPRRITEIKQLYQELLMSGGTYDN